MKSFLAAVVGFGGASLYQSHSKVEAWGFLNKPAFSQKDFQSYKLISVEEESHDTKRFRFALPADKTRLDLPIASCVTLRFTDAKGQEVARPYTPINLENDEGHFDLVVKCYPDSKMGSHLFSMKPGDSIEAKGPWHTFEVKPSQYYQIGMIAGGTGITPMYQVINNVLHGQDNTTKISLLYSNKTEGDVLLGNELEELGKKFSGKFATYYCLTTAPKRWTGYTGFIDKKMIEETMPGPEHEGDSVILVCGPPPFMKSICGSKDYNSHPPKQGPLDGYLKEMGYTEKGVYKF
ncbi:putative mitochondrial NADH-cytochrome b5 reductase [Leptomonas pyrrhocoris]|uniref:NADH-cytochrome b5 reductase n=1 Tax=Leptomonas pyrrhocoris TaxID=157538 RepID=A0A0M9G9N2_LEPPY|nr:putative mitochondrial NADH-cytochrome b5 reductase [Leptomonas pyrrhocoris]XP_015664130.1 putative mitochondrial NADH-cytochrome b5 reductase [Leptomonas pyrrhocoris]XP_015664131.1 putative mitochondrial NADH-cytochrome b5 reductase [Leptomonas pyrrhocoris]KPA85690.1 putative mitochondrial NADH-cytochrome b5 reductase [Leptomonas pyrrhocoris]KPA85691.1 putative mitochondrial NADH-cytochrome b5 reductase [Leptomonas pyrrhocoris]KPA85692.1 putative mitochondrial NADH-cytochrome b5 reductase |eukprot:XP_015664129.1 putative mitochondrial NADH-cytochrome b5 reductase [Leptomonas pyrrhocoris]